MDRLATAQWSALLCTGLGIIVLSMVNEARSRASAVDLDTRLDFTPTDEAGTDEMELAVDWMEAGDKAMQRTEGDD